MPAPTVALPVDTGDAIAALLLEVGHLTAKQQTYAKRVQSKLPQQKPC